MGIPIVEAIMIADATLTLGNKLIDILKEQQEKGIETLSHDDLKNLLAIPEFESFLEDDNDEIQ